MHISNLSASILATYFTVKQSLTLVTLTYGKYFYGFISDNSFYLIKVLEMDLEMVYYIFETIILF
jgi:hypothetical protein